MYPINVNGLGSCCFSYVDEMQAFPTFCVMQMSSSYFCFLNPSGFCGSLNPSIPLSQWCSHYIIINNLHHFLPFFVNLSQWTMRIQSQKSIWSEFCAPWKSRITLLVIKDSDRDFLNGKKLKLGREW